MKELTKARSAWKEVRRSLFPRWDRVKRWRFHVDRHLPSQGYCDPDKKKIVLSLIPADDNELRTLLIHEICHSFSQDHKLLWQRRMLKAARDCRRLGLVALSNHLQAEVKGYQDSIAAKLDSPASVYARIENTVMDNPTVSYRPLITWMAREYGCSVREFESFYRRCRRVYNKAKKFM